MVLHSTVFIYRKTGEIVANCHKLPENLFVKKILTIDENIKNLNEVVSIIKNNNPQAKIIFILSPIRHNPNNITENQYSKSILRVSFESIINNKSIFYFPSYELVMDELRNYDFYKEDGIHLKKNTINIIMERFENCYFDNELKLYFEKFNQIRKFRKHKPFNEKSAEYFELLKKNLILLIHLGLQKKSLILEKEIFILCLRLWLEIFIQNMNWNYF